MTVRSCCTLNKFKYDLKQHIPNHLCIELNDEFVLLPVLVIIIVVIYSFILYVYIRLFICYNLIFMLYYTGLQCKTVCILLIELSC